MLGHVDPSRFRFARGQDAQFYLWIESQKCDDHLEVCVNVSVFQCVDELPILDVLALRGLFELRTYNHYTVPILDAPHLAKVPSPPEPCEAAGRQDCPHY